MASDPDSWWLDERAYAGREHFDEQHSRRYDAKEDARAAEEVELLQRLRALTPDATVVDIGAGTGQFTLAAAGVCRRVVALDVSPVMLARLRENVRCHGANNVEIAESGFLTYEHAGPPADVVYTRLAHHHLPDFWKAIALQRIGAIVRPGGILRLSDIVYDFDAADAASRIEAWIAENAGDDPRGGWTRAELAEHVRDEHSTFAWLLEPMIERAGFAIEAADHSPDGMVGRYVCRRTATG
jgi:SAM-dependent methyltransferase